MFAVVFVLEKAMIVKLNTIIHSYDKRVKQHTLVIYMFDIFGGVKEVFRC